MQLGPWTALGCADLHLGRELTTLHAGGHRHHNTQNTHACRYPHACTHHSTHVLAPAHPTHPIRSAAARWQPPATRRTPATACRWQTGTRAPSCGHVCRATEPQPVSQVDWPAAGPHLQLRSRPSHAHHLQPPQLRLPPHHPPSPRRLDLCLAAPPHHPPSPPLNPPHRPRPYPATLPPHTCHWT